MNPTTEDGNFHPLFVYILIALFVSVTGFISYQGYSASNTAQQIKKETKESSEVFQKIEGIRKGEIRISQIDKEKETIVADINKKNKELKKYRINSTSQFITE